MTEPIENILGAALFLAVVLGMVKFYKWDRLPGEDETRYKARMTMNKFGIFLGIAIALVLVLETILPAGWWPWVLRLFRQT